jgi:NADH-quinone oxidoreductase subunit H
MMKLLAFIFVFIWLRGTLPRLRYDQFMRFGWKFLIPGGLIWIVAVSLIRAIRVQQPQGGQRLALLAGLVLIVLFVLWAFLASSRRDEEAAAARRVVVPPEIDPFEGGYPVPPMPGQTIRRSSGPVLTAHANGEQSITAATTTQTALRDNPETDEEVRGG